MKNILRLVSILIFLHTVNVSSQNYLGYYFIPTEYDYYTELTGGIVSSATGNDGAENINLPFQFEYMGITYSTARISVNGWLEMGQTYISTGANNELESNIKKPFICPLWDDLYADSQSEIRYETIGEYPARFFVVQWKNILIQSGLRKSFQVRLWEIDGTIDFIYGPGPSSMGYFDDFSVGMNNQIGGPDNFISVTIEDQFYYTVSTTVANNMNDDVSLLIEGMLLSFVPIYSGSRSAFLYQTPDSLIIGNPNQKIFAIIFTCHAGGVLTPPWVTKFNFNTNGTTNTSDINNAKLFYTGSNPYFSTNIQIGSTIPNPDGLFEIGGFSNYLNNNGLSYYWLAYDISPSAIIGNFVDANCFRIDFEGCCPSIIPDSSLAELSCIITGNNLPTLLSIGIGGDYLNIQEALQDLQSQTITRPHILELLDSYEPSNESFPIEFSLINGSSQTNTIIIRPKINTPEIILSSDTTIIKFYNSTYTTIDGRPGSIIPENYLNMVNTSNNSSTILFYNGAQFDSIKYCNIYGGDARSDGGVVLFSATNYSNSNNVLVNCLITNNANYLPANMVKIFNSYSGGGSHHKVEKCEIKNFTKSGIEIYSADHSMLVNNLIHNEYPVQSNLLYGINNYGKYITISKCKIYDLNSNLNEPNKIVGINTLRAHSGIVDNNFISLSGNEQSTITGIFIKGELFSDNYYFYYNTINIYGNNANSSNSYCFHRDYTLADNILYNNWYLKNNIFINERTNLAGSGIHLAIAVNDPYYSADFDYNDYYVNFMNTYLGLWSSSYASNIDEWKLLSNRDFNSVSQNVKFISNIDLHLTGASVGDSLLIGVPISEITTDIDGELRDPLFPYKGADEVDVPVSSEIIKNLQISFTLSQNYPNPFNPMTNIGFTIAEFGFVNLKVFDILGKEIATLVNEEKPAGVYEIEFDGTALPSGIYFYQLKAENYLETRKMVLLR